MPKIFSDEEKVRMKERLMEVGLELLESKRYRSASIEEIARQAGIAKGTFYNFFDSKEIFFFDIILGIRENNRKGFYDFFTPENNPDEKSTEEFLYNHYLNSKNIYHYFTEDELKVIFRKMPKEISAANEDSPLLFMQLMANLPNVNPNLNGLVVLNVMDIMANFMSDKRYSDFGGEKETLRFLAKSLAEYIFEK